MTDELRKRLKQLRSEIASGDTERAARAAPELRSVVDEAQQTEAQAEAEIEKAKQAIVSGEGIGRIAEDAGVLVFIGGVILLIMTSVWAFSNTWSWVWDVAALLGIALATYVLASVVTGSLRFLLLIFAIWRGKRRAQPSAIRERRQRAEKQARREAKRQERSERLSARIDKIRGFSLEWNTFRFVQRLYLQRKLDAQKRHDRETGITRNPPLPTAKELQNMGQEEIKQRVAASTEATWDELIAKYDTKELLAKYGSAVIDIYRADIERRSRKQESVEQDVVAPSPRSEPASEGSSGGLQALAERFGEDRIDAFLDRVLGYDEDDDE